MRGEAEGGRGDKGEQAAADRGEGQGAQDQPAAGAAQPQGDGDRGPARSHKAAEGKELQPLRLPRPALR